MPRAHRGSRSQPPPALGIVALALALAVSTCTFQFDRSHDPRRDAGTDPDASIGDDAGGLDASADASRGDSGLCVGAANGAPCPGGVCWDGACCGGCVSPGGCEPGDTVAACGLAGAVCRVCADETPRCGERGRCSVAHPAIEISLGLAHVCARDAEGRVYCWGSDTSGQIGVRDPAGACLVAEPTLVPLPMPASEVRAGGAGTCATRVDGSGYCWGRGLAGAGTRSAPSTCVDEEGTTVARSDPASIDPVRVVPGELPLGWLSLATGLDVRFGLNTAGRPFWWGDRGGTTIVVDQPMRVAGPDLAFVELRAHEQYAFARTSSGALHVLGYGFSATGPVLDPPIAIDVGVYGVGRHHVCWVLADQRIECEGSHLEADWEDGPNGGRIVPRSAGDLSPITSVAVSYNAAPAHACWANEASELRCTFTGDEPMMLRAQREFVAVAVWSTRFSAIDGAGRV
jgi:hypothetical protein